MTDSGFFEASGQGSGHSSAPGAEECPGLIEQGRPRDDLGFVAIVHRPDLPDVHLGFAFAHQAERASRKLTADLRCTAHVEGTTITWAPRTTEHEVLEPLPADAYAISELIKEQDDRVEPKLRFPDLWTRLRAQEVDDDAHRIWQQACWWLDAEAERSEDGEEEPDVHEIEAALAVLAASGRYSVKDNQTGRWVR